MNSTLILFKEIGRQLLIVGLVLGSLPMAIRILWKLQLLPRNKTVLAALGSRTPNSLHFDLCRLCAVLPSVLDRAFHPAKAGGTDHGRVSSSLYKGSEAG